jgi:hypothetical protein
MSEIDRQFENAMKGELWWGIGCTACGKPTDHRHMHDTAHGIAGTHMAGTERYVCTKCGNAIYAKEGRERGLHFILDKVES